MKNIILPFLIFFCVSMALVKAEAKLYELKPGKMHYLINGRLYYLDELENLRPLEPKKPKTKCQIVRLTDSAFDSYCVPKFYYE